MVFQARTVVEEDDVSAFIEKHRGNWSRITDVFDGIKWGLARAPEKGYQLNDVWLFKSYPWDGQSLVVLYEFDDDTVTIKAINFGQD